MANRADRFTATDRKSQFYSDFLSNLNPHPVAKDIVRYVNETAVIRSIKNLILTNRGERLYQPKIGSDIQSMLFEPMGSASAELISTYVLDTIDKYEPRAKVLNVDVLPDYENNLYTVNIVFFVINKQEPVTTQITLIRVR